MPAWTRPYDPDSHVVVYTIAALMSVGGLIPLCGAIAYGYTPIGLAVSIAFVVGFEVLLWRVVLVGLFLGDQGIKVRMVTRTTMIPWSRVIRARVGPATGSRRARTIWIVVRDGEDVETPIWQTGRPSHRNRIKLPPQQQADLVGSINDMAARRVG